MSQEEGEEDAGEEDRQHPQRQGQAQILVHGVGTVGTLVSQHAVTSHVVVNCDAASSLVTECFLTGGQAQSQVHTMLVAHGKAGEGWGQQENTGTLCCLGEHALPLEHGNNQANKHRPTWLNNYLAVKVFPP